MKYLFGLIISVLLIEKAFPQTQNIDRTTESKYSFSGGMGVSFFNYDTKVIEQKFASPSFRAGIATHKKISRYLFLKYGFNLGIKLKTTPLYTDYSPSPLFKLDQTNSAKNHYFFEVPLTLNYNSKKIGINAGVMYRSFLQFDNIKYVNYYTANAVGLIPGVSYKINNKMTIGAEYYVGLIKFYQGYDFDKSGGTINYVVRNHYAMLTLDYALRSRSHQKKKLTSSMK